MPELLDEFEAEFVGMVRDEAISTLDRFLAGGDRSDRGRRLQSPIGHLSPEEVSSHLQLPSMQSTKRFIRSCGCSKNPASSILSREAPLESVSAFAT